MFVKEMRKAVASVARALSAVFLLRRQRTDLRGRLGPSLRQRLRQHHLFGVDRHRGLHAGAGYRQLRGRRSGRTARYAAGGATCFGCSPRSNSPIGLLALGISVLLPHLGDFSAAISSYTLGRARLVRPLACVVRGARRDRDRAAHTGHDAHGRHADPANPSSDSERSRPNRPLDTESTRSVPPSVAS